MDILDQYVIRFPTDQNVVDLFDGEWSSRMPSASGLISRPGTAALFEDSRIDWAEQQLGGFSDRDILELGPLECGHTYMLHRRGAKSITSIEANSRAFLKCLCVKQLFALDRAFLKLGDFVAFLRENKKKFDVTIASGVLYHMQQPIEVLDLMCSSADSLFIWTHYYDANVVTANKTLAKKFAASEVRSYNGFKYECSRQSYEKALDWAGFCGGPERESVWLTKDSILNFVQHRGFSAIDIAFDQTTHPNGPAFAICAKRP
jgi:hypothetical protein